MLFSKRLQVFNCVFRRTFHRLCHQYAILGFPELTRNNNTAEFADMTVSGAGFAATSEHFRESRSPSVVSWAAIRLDTQLIVDGAHDPLLRAKVSGGLHRPMSKQELNLFVD
jgi:hypothetical protein